MRIRSVKPDFFKDVELAELEPICRILFEGLWCMADGHGRLQDSPKRIKAEVLPYDDFDVDAGLSKLAEAGFIARYAVNDDFFIQVNNFKKHQRITGKEAETESEYPRNPSEKSIKKRVTPGQQRGNTGVTAGDDPGNSGATAGALEGKGKEGNGELPPMSPPFQKPSKPEIYAYAGSINYGLDVDRFYEFYEKKNWEINGKPMRNWKLAVQTWKKNDEREVKNKSRLGALMPEGKEI